MEKVKKVLRRFKYSKTKELSDRITRLEDNLCRAYEALEYKVWQNNNLSNQLFYELDLAKKKKKDINPLVSIVMPVYNGSNYLSEAIDCALRQTYKNIEIIVVNDGSTDGGKSEEVAKKYLPKIRYYNKENGGVSSALNYGIKKMKGEYFAWLSHDDLIDDDHIERLVNHISHVGNEDDIPFSSFKLVDDEGKLLFDTIPGQLHCNDYKMSFLKNELSLLTGEINGGSVLIPKKAFDECGVFDERLRISQERDMWSRLIEKYHFVNIPFDTASIRSHASQVTNTNPDVARETNAKNLEIIDKMLADEEIARRLFGSRDIFLAYLEKFYSDHNNKYMAGKIQRLRK